MVFLPSSNSDLSRALNFSRGRSRKSAARRTSGLTLASTFAGLPSDRASSASTARFSCSTFFASPFGGFRERLGIGTLHARPQARQRAELQLLHRAFGLANLPRHFLNAFLFHKPQHHHALLLSGQRVDQPKQSCPPFHFFELSVAGRRGVDQSRLVRHLLSIRALPAIRNQIRRNPVEPRRKRNPPPLKPLQIGQRMMKHLGGQILGLRAIPPPAALHTRTPARNYSRKAPQSTQDPSAPPRSEAARPLGVLCSEPSEPSNRFFARSSLTQG